MGVIQGDTKKSDYIAHLMAGFWAYRSAFRGVWFRVYWVREYRFGVYLHFPNTCHDGL